VRAEQCGVVRRWSHEWHEWSRMRVAVPMNPDGRSFVFLREIRGSGTLGKACTGSIPGEGRRKDKRTGLFAPLPHRHREERRPGGPRSRQFPRRQLPALPGTDHGRDGEEVVWDWAGERGENGKRMTGSNGLGCHSSIFSSKSQLRSMDNYADTGARRNVNPVERQRHLGHHETQDCGATKP